VPDAEPAWLTHNIDGRARIRLPQRRGDAAYLTKVAGELQAIPQVIDVQPNPLTGGLLVQHRGALEPILERARSQGLFDVSPEAPEGPPVGEQLRRQFRELSTGLQQATSGQTDLASVIFLVLLVGAVVQLLRGNFLAPAATLLWYAASVLMLSQSLGDAQGARDTGEKAPAPAPDQNAQARKAA